MTDRDLTPAEARAEVEAFLGPEWLCGTNAVFPGAWATRDLLCLEIEEAATYRAAVDALKQAWRDAVRPWVAKGYEAGYTKGHAWGVFTNTTDREREWNTKRVNDLPSKEQGIARVLKEDSHGNADV